MHSFQGFETVRMHWLLVCVGTRAHSQQSVFRVIEDMPFIYLVILLKTFSRQLCRIKLHTDLLHFTQSGIIDRSRDFVIWTHHWAVDSWTKHTDEGLFQDA